MLGAILLLVSAGMLLYLVPSYNTGASSDSQVVAEVAGEPITVPDVQKVIEVAMRGQQIPAEILPNYVPQVVNDLVTERALAYQAAKLGFVVTDDQLRAGIEQMIPNLFPDGKFVGRDVYAAMLAQQGMTIPEFEDNMRRQLLITRLRDVELEGSIVTPLEIEQAYRKKNEKIQIAYVKISADKYKAEAQPSTADMQDYYKVNSSRFTIPAKMNLTILVADQAKMMASLNPTDADLHRMYNQNMDQYRVPETVKVRHILLKTQGKPASEDGKIRAQAEAILKQVKAGANFTDLVKKYSEDTASVPNGGVYEVQHNGQMVPEFENAAFALKPGESTLIKTTYGYHILQVMQHDPARLKPFDEVKPELITAWKTRRAADLMNQVSDKAQSMLQKDPTHPEKVAAALDMEVIHADGVEPGKTIPEIGDSPDFQQAIAGLKQGEVSQPVALANSKIVLAVVTGLQPARPATFEEVQNQIKDSLTQSRSLAAVQKHAQELLDKTKAMNGDLEKAAKSMGLEVKTSNEFSRADTVDGLGPASYVQDGFGQPNGTLIGPIPTPDATIIAKVVAHVDPDMSKLPAQRDTIRDEIKSQKARDRNMLFEAGVRDQMIKQGKIKIYQKVIDRLITNYRTNS